jgi:hypothetical protein
VSDLKEGALVVVGEKPLQRKTQATFRKVRRQKQRPREGRNGDTLIGYLGSTALRREESDM